jgi:predicted transcriptional regulator
MSGSVRAFFILVIMEDLIKTDEILSILNISQDTWTRFLKSKNIKGLKIGKWHYYLRSIIDDYLDSLK